MLWRVDAVLHRIEALPGEGRYAVTFRRHDGVEQTAVAQVGATDVEIAESALPVGWTRDSTAARATAEAVTALDAARRLADPSGATLRDVDGGWDVGLGNIVLDTAGTPRCTAHGPLADEGDGAWACPECGARALYG
ncbi:hypothetical protein SAMN05443575_0064 [Jatrophihabitans endophyticus]|uniref:Uncharacterized protein n=1 Tax=Jatrophihabitans endophyticus TaxID=1206085 RepID=A0A1M5C0W3_9ACTN|nr:hypothetical protein [Jatrophihabitans endophyticus]SHF48424.1 hypothetical protein SAMN05443575_0064 [Jatrophihabitans endophyticus]